MTLEISTPGRMGTAFSVLFLITARGGSRGVPGKNLRTLGGLSLVAIKAIAARGSRYCTRLIISTDSEEIALEAKRYGAEVPFMRPAELASDTAQSADVIEHAMDQLEARGEHYDAIMLLEPSSPFTRAEDFDAAVELMARTNAQAVVGMRRMEVNSVFVGSMDEQGCIGEIVRKMESLRSVLRQDRRPEYTMNGALYLFRWEYFRTHKNIYHDEHGVYGYVMPDALSLEIDEMKDLHLAEFLVDKGYIDLANWR